jgi:hypothetical protein
MQTLYSANYRLLNINPLDQPKGHNPHRKRVFLRFSSWATLIGRLYGTRAPHIALSAAIPTVLLLCESLVNAALGEELQVAGQLSEHIPGFVVETAFILLDQIGPVGPVVHRIMLVQLPKPNAHRTKSQQGNCHLIWGGKGVERMKEKMKMKITHLPGNTSLKIAPGT